LISPSAALSATGFSGTVSYAIAPALPTGLSLDSSTGVISGTPTAPQALTSYVMTGTGATSGSATAGVSIAISASPPPPPPPNPIPTLSEWAQVLMMLSMIGIVGYGRRRHA
jgi:hypothetical protein